MTLTTKEHEQVNFEQPTDEQLAKERRDFAEQFRSFLRFLDLPNTHTHSVRGDVQDMQS